jgi:ABC-2 type transport system ATP-binding protein
MPETAIETEGLTKRFGDTVAADEVTLTVPQSTVVGLLGPNGAGKTTIVRMLTTLLAPDGGQATVAGYDVVTQPREVRSVIGLTGQYAALDPNLTGRENIEMIGQLYQLPRRVARKRTTELLERFELSFAADRTVKTYSGGMTRRLDLAASLIAEPRILFLDEPTTGLDPRSRRGMWQVIRELVDEGATLLLTTQYLEEADLLADSIAVLDGGKLIAEGTADELKSQVGGQLLEVRLADGSDLEDARRVVTDLAHGEVQIRDDAGEHRLLVPIGQDRTLLADAIRRLDDKSLEIADISVHKPTLDDVFFALTGASPDTPRTNNDQESQS